MINRELIVHQQVCDYLRLQYPRAIFHSDHEGGRKRHRTEQANIKRLNSSRAWPDLFIAEPSVTLTFSGDTGDLPTDGPFYKWAGLFIELKAEDIYLKRPPGNILKADKHLQEQNDMLIKLRLKGYKAEFAVGFYQAKAIIDEYFHNKPEAQFTDKEFF